MPWQKNLLLQDYLLKLVIRLKHGILFGVSAWTPTLLAGAGPRFPRFGDTILVPGLLVTQGSRT